MELKLSRIPRKWIKTRASELKGCELVECIACIVFHFLRLAGIGGKDTSLFLFRALGKILHCKRKTKTTVYTCVCIHITYVCTYTGMYVCMTCMHVCLCVSVCFIVMI